MTTAESPLLPGTQLDHYQLEEIVATTRRAVVFRAIDSLTGQQVAIKVPHADTQSDPTLADRFQREEEIGIKLDHPGIMKIYSNSNRSRVYMVMEWLDGRRLGQILKDEPKLPANRAIKLAVGLCNALEYAHANGVVHRDLGPDKIMVDAEDNVKIFDFGFAAITGARRLTFANLSASLGTPDYISPEQVGGARGDARSDIYSAGVILYEMLTGAKPFSGANAFAIMNDRLLRDPVPPRTVNPQISPPLQTIILHALEREPKNRYASARAFAHDLRHPEQVEVIESHGVSPNVLPIRKDEGKKAKSNRTWIYIVIAIIPLLIFGLLFLMSRGH